MNKPIVFLSHSSKDKMKLAALKALLERQTVGAIDFFLSTDGQSISLGTVWVHALVDALKGTKLMFVFVTEGLLKSGWIYFEAGHAFSKDIHVVPCCLPGVELKQLPAPLSLLQGQTLHSAKDLNSIIAKCNQAFALKIPEKIKAKEFDALFLAAPSESSVSAVNRLVDVQFFDETQGVPIGTQLRFETTCVAIPRDADLPDYNEHFPTYSALPRTRDYYREVAHYIHHR